MTNNEKELGKIVRENSPDHKEWYRIAVHKDRKGQHSLDVRQYINTQREKPFKGFTRRGLRLYRHQVIELLTYLPEIKSDMDIDDDEIEIAREGRLSKT
jgi:hypothetical protein